MATPRQPNLIADVSVRPRALARRDRRGRGGPSELVWLALAALALIVVPASRAQDAAAGPTAPAVIKPVIVGRGSSPARPLAGRVFRKLYFILRSDGNGAFTTAVPNAVVTVKTTIADKVVPRHVFVYQGPTEVTLKIPLSAKGKQLKITITVRGGGEVAAKTRTYRVL